MEAFKIKSKVIDIAIFLLISMLKAWITLKNLHNNVLYIRAQYQSTSNKSSSSGQK